MADDISDCSTLNTAFQEHTLAQTYVVTLECVHNGVSFSARKSDGAVLRCVLAGVVCPAVRQSGYEHSKNYLFQVLTEQQPFTVLTHMECQPWYRLTHAIPVTVILGHEDLRLMLLKDGWVNIDSEMPKKCRKLLFTKAYWSVLKNMQKEALTKLSGLNADVRTRCFVHPKTFYKVFDADSPDIFFATKPPKLPHYVEYCSSSSDSENV